METSGALRQDLQKEARAWLQVVRFVAQPSVEPGHLRGLAWAAEALAKGEQIAEVTIPQLRGLGDGAIDARDAVQELGRQLVGSERALLERLIAERQGTAGWVAYALEAGPVLEALGEAQVPPLLSVVRSWQEEASGQARRQVERSRDRWDTAVQDWWKA